MLFNKVISVSNTLSDALPRLVHTDALEDLPFLISLDTAAIPGLLKQNQSSFSPAALTAYGSFVAAQLDLSQQKHYAAQLIGFVEKVKYQVQDVDSFDKMDERQKLIVLKSINRSVLPENDYLKVMPFFQPCIARGTLFQLTALEYGIDLHTASRDIELDRGLVHMHNALIDQRGIFFIDVTNPTQVSDLGFQTFQTYSWDETIALHLFGHAQEIALGPRLDDKNEALDGIKQSISIRAEEPSFYLKRSGVFFSLSEYWENQGNLNYRNKYLELGLADIKKVKSFLDSEPTGRQSNVYSFAVQIEELVNSALSGQ